VAKRKGKKKDKQKAKRKQRQQREAEQEAKQETQPEAQPEAKPGPKQASNEKGAETTAERGPLTREQRLKRKLRTPRGQLLVLAAVILISVPLGVIVGLNRTFFEGFAREKYPEATEVAVEAAGVIAAGKATAETVRELSAPDRDGLYRLWMRQEPKVAGPVDGPRGDQLPPDPTKPLLEAQVLGPLLFEVDPGRYARLLKATLVAGTPEQRKRALELSRYAPPSEALVEVLRFALDRARRLADEQEPLLEEVLQGVATVHTKS
jgi:hypothetical protein